MTTFSSRKRRTTEELRPAKRVVSSHAPLSQERVERDIDQLVDRFSLSLSDKYDRECVPIPIKDLGAAVQAGKDIMQQRRSVAPMEVVVETLEEKEAVMDAEEENDAFTDELCKQFEAECKAVDDSQTVQTRAELSADLLKEQRRCGGDQRLEAIRLTLNSLGYTRSHFQKAGF